MQAFPACSQQDVHPRWIHLLLSPKPQPVGMGGSGGIVGIPQRAV